jgi:Tol biopolymer transport system component/serine/threonine protein kinase
MALQPGTRLGGYDILGLVGAGGMGEVYRARDPRLGREVAIKVLPADRVADEGRRRRFVQEAQAASALNHPHIITIYEIGTAEDHDFIVMEYVPGTSVDGLIPRQGMRLSEALRIAIPVADALAAAHARGIIHRDLKPANVVVGTDGAVKVLDFGLAKLVGADEDSAVETATLTAHGTLSAPGTVVGTAAYMAPEQATGGAVDARSDIFSFGAMLYEMVTGQRAFAGTSTNDTLSAVIRAQPKAPSTIVRDLPSDLEKVILRCLRKDPQRRFQHVGDVKVALQEIKEESESGTAQPAPAARTRRPGLIAAVAAAVLVVVASGALLLWQTRQRSEPPAAARVVPLTTLTGWEFHPTFSPDGEQVAFTWNGPKQENWDIYVTLVGSSDVRRLTTDPAEDVWPAWSPDGRQIAFVRQRLEDSTVHLVSPLGGGERRLSDFRGADSITWSPDGRWLAVGRSGSLNFGSFFYFNRPVREGPRGISLIPAEGGATRPLIASTPGHADSKPAFSPDGRRLAYMSCRLDLGFFGMADCDILLVELNTAMAVAASPKALRTQRSAAVTLMDSVAWTRDGSALVYRAAGGLWRVAVDETRAPERLGVVGTGAVAPAAARSRDRLAFTQVSYDSDIFGFEAGRSPQLLTGSSVLDEDVRFSPDGRKLLFTSTRSGTGGVPEIWVADADGSNPQQLTRGPGRQGSPYWSPDGRRVAFDSQAADGRYHIWMIDTDGGTPRRLTMQVADEVVPTWSHDGRWIYFSGDQGTGRDIWRVPAAGGIPDRLTQGAGGPFACESADGKSLLFQTKDADSPLMMLALTGGEPRRLIACVKNSAFGVGPRGVYYVPCEVRADPSLRVLDLTTGRDERLGTLDGMKDRPLGLSVSPDGKTVAYPRQVLSRADLMLIENFR